MSNDNVIDIPPASFDETYCGYHIQYRFVPATKLWLWEFTIPVNPIRFSDNAVSRKAAIKAAHKQVDKVEVIHP